MESPKYSSKYPRRKPVGKPNNKIENTTKSTVNTMAKEDNGADNASQNNPEESHENFIKDVKPNNEPTLEPVNEISANPHAQAKIHRGYALDGIKQNSVEGENASGETTTKAATPEPPEEDPFEPTPPQSGDAPEQPNMGSSTEGPDGPGTQPFNLPTGSAEDLIDAGAKALNYIIEQYGDLAVGIKIHQDFYSVPDAVPKIKEQNQRNVEKIKLSSTEIEMLKKPLVKIMQEKGIRGLTTGEELLLAVVIIVAGKVKVIYVIRQENKKLENNIIAEIRSMRKHNAQFSEQDPKKETTTSSTNGDDIPLTPAEEEN